MGKDSINHHPGKELDAVEEVLDIVRKSQNESLLCEEGDAEETKKAGAKDTFLPSTKTSAVIAATVAANTTSNAACSNGSGSGMGEAEELDILKMVAQRCRSHTSSAHAYSGQPMEAVEVEPTTLHRCTANTAALPGAFHGTPREVSRRAQRKIPFSMVGSTTSSTSQCSAATSGSNEDFDTESPACLLNENHASIDMDMEANAPVAQPVTEDPNQESLPQAERTEDTLQEARDLMDKRARYKALLLLALPMLALLAASVLLCIFLVPEKQQQPTPTKAPYSSQAPHPGLSPEEHIWQLLPQESKQQIQRGDAITGNILTPQTLAYQWMTKDPNVRNYTQAKILQRFALATFYHATNGDHHWTNNTNWLSYQHDECQWFSRDMMLYVQKTPIFQTFPFTSIDAVTNASWPCDQLGMYTHFWLFGNNLKGTIPQQFYLLSHLKIINMHVNDFEGSTISTNIGKLTSLQVFGANNAALAGSLPTQIGLLTNLHTLATGTNSIKGTLPSQLGLLTNVVTFALDESKLSGSIPMELGTLSSLKIVRSSNNQLSGWIPSQLGLLTDLQDLSLAGNHLSGPIPEQLDQLVPSSESNVAGKKNGSMIILRLEGNRFSGAVPNQLCKIVGKDSKNDTSACPWTPYFQCGLFFECSTSSEGLCGCDCPCANP